ncbi:MAG: DUF3592 domain-containing protein [Deltaproteobacteria bacterium]|nr:DUF3592 domain-containing protein [Deltaproteobacteria bacterium]
MARKKTKKNNFDNSNSDNQNIVFMKILGLLTLFVLFVMGMQYNQLKGTFFSDKLDLVETDGRVIKSNRVTKTSRGLSYHYNIVYEYYVNGKQYQSNQVSFGATGSKDKAFSKKYILKYPSGKPVTVYYDLNNPGFAVLEPEVTSERSWYILTGIIFLNFLLFGYLWFSGRKKVAIPQ